MSKKRCKKCSRDLEYGNKKLCPICSHIQYTCKTKHHRLSSKSLSKMSIAQLKEYMKIYKETNGHIPYELKTDIEFQLLKEKEANKVFANKLIKSKWFSLGIAQTIRN